MLNISPFNLESQSLLLFQILLPSALVCCLVLIVFTCTLFSFFCFFFSVILSYFNLKKKKKKEILHFQYDISNQSCQNIFREGSILCM